MAQIEVLRIACPYQSQRGREVRTVNLAIHMSAAVPPDFATRLRDVAAAVDPASTMDDIEPLNDVYWYLSLVDYIFGSAPALIALGVLLFATVGIYTRMSFTLVQRRREIGIRAALGASGQQLVAGTFRSVFVPLLIGGGLGAFAALALYFYASPLLLTSAGGRSFPWILPAAEAFVLMMGIVAVFGPVVRTLRVAPTEALREN